MIGTAARITPANHLLDATTRRTLGQVLSIVEAGAMLSACPDTRIVVLHRKRLVTPNENKISHRWRGPAFSSPFYFSNFTFAIFETASGWLHRMVRPLASRSLFTRAPEQDDTQQERHDEWDSRDSDNKTRIGVPWRRSPVRILDTSEHEEQQRNPIHDHECASCPAPKPLDSTKGSRKRRRREIGQKARNKK